MILMTARNTGMLYAGVEMSMIMTELLIVNNLKIRLRRATDAIDAIMT